MAFLLDSNIFIESRKNLPMDVWTTFWQRLSELAMDGKVVSCIKVKEDIDNDYDELSSWIKTNVPDGFFLPLDSDDMTAYAMLQNWAAGRDFTDAAKTDFASKTDAFIIAKALAKGMHW